MDEYEVSRTLVKSAPELWMACSDESTLARHLRQFGEIRITRLEPETTVAWEGDAVCGTVRIESSGWGTRVTLTACEIGRSAAIEPPEPAEPPVTEAVLTDEPARDATAATEEPEEQPEPAPAPPARPGFWRRLFARRGPTAEPPAEPHADPPGEHAPEGTDEHASDAIGEPQASAAPAPEPVADSQPEIDPLAALGEQLESRELPARDPFGPYVDAAAALDAVLDSLGQAHHRPFSRS